MNTIFGNSQSLHLFQIGKKLQLVNFIKSTNEKMKLSDFEWSAVSIRTLVVNVAIGAYM